MPTTPRHVVIAGGGVAAAEAALALHALAADAVELTLISPRPELVVPPLAVAEPFALGHPQRVPLRLLARAAAAELAAGAVARVDAERRTVALEDGREVSFDALLIAVGARPVARVEHALTWWPGRSEDALHGLLQDMEEGYSRRVAFVIPPGAVWPLPLYELALLCARQVQSMGIEGLQLTVVTPEAVPLSLFGTQAGRALRDELRHAAVRLETASLVRVDRRHGLELVLQPSGRRLGVERIVALPGLDGPAIPGTAQDEHGFIRVGRDGRMAGSECVWAAGDAIASPVKFGGLAARQAASAAAAIAGGLGRPGPAEAPPPLSGTLLTGTDARALGATGPAATKLQSSYLGPFLDTAERAAGLAMAS